MTGAPRGAGLLRRALLLTALTGAVGAGLSVVALGPQMSGWLRQVDLTLTPGVRLAVAAGLAVLIGWGCSVWFFGAADRAVGAALGTLAAPEEGGGAQEVDITRLSVAVQEWRHRARAAEAARERLERAAGQLARALEAAGAGAGDADHKTSGPAATLKPADYEDEALRGLAAAAQGTIEAAGRLRGVLEALLERVADDMNGVSEPLPPLAETIAGMGRVLEDLVATYPEIRTLAALQVALDDCGGEVARARQAAALVHRELEAVRRRMGGARADRLTARDLLDGGPRETTREGRA